MPDAKRPRSTAADAQRRLAAGDFGAARNIATVVLADTTSDAESSAAHLVLAACSRKAGDIDSALGHARAAVGLNPLDAVAYYALAEQMEAGRDVAGAVANLRRAIALNANFVQAHNYLGILLGESGDARGAAMAFANAVRIDPAHFRAWNNLGNAQRTLGQLQDAERSFARALELCPDYALAAANLGGIQRDTGAVESAEATARSALARLSGKPPFRPLLVLLAGLLRERGALDEAAQLYAEAIKATPDQSAGEWFNLGNVLNERGQSQQARDAYARASKTDRRELRGLIASKLCLPMVYADAAGLHAARDAYAHDLAALQPEIDIAMRGLTAADVIDGLRWTNFFLAYQGGDDRVLQMQYAALAARAIDTVAPHLRTALPRQAVVARRIRIGFASAFFHVGTCGRYFQSWITELDRERFEVFVYHLWPGMDDIASDIERRADHFRTFGGSQSRPSIVAPVIRNDELDILVYPELGMDTTSFVLAAMRLAPRQLAGWGHPVTTGHATIDAYLSCAPMEPEAAATHYAERLITLPGIGTRYVRPDIPVDATRAQFGLPAERALLLCPQSLFKIHPDTDAIYAAVLARNLSAMLVLFTGRHPAVTDQFMRRFAATLASAGIAIRDRVIVLPQVGHEDYLRVNLVCDAMVDTLHWSGGNTSLDALACGLPVITLPGEFMRGRQSAGMLALMGVTELIARDRAEYVSLTTRMVDDATWRQSLRGRIAAAQDQLFNRSDAIARLHDVFVAEVTTDV
jgi:predicted O-linked N-acetylglucosamine transferase (SPINDLY family)